MKLKFRSGSVPFRSPLVKQYWPSLVLERMMPCKRSAKGSRDGGVEYFVNSTTIMARHAYTLSIYQSGGAIFFVTDQNCDGISLVRSDFQTVADNPSALL